MAKMTVMERAMQILDGQAHVKVGALVRCQKYGNEYVGTVKRVMRTRATVAFRTKGGEVKVRDFSIKGLRPVFSSTLPEMDVAAEVEAEQAFERLAAFGPGVTVVNVVTGQTYRT